MGRGRCRARVGAVLARCGTAWVPGCGPILQDTSATALELLVYGPRASHSGLEGHRISKNLSRGDTRTLEPVLGHPGPNDSGRGCHKASSDLHLATARCSRAPP